LNEQAFFVIYLAICGVSNNANLSICNS